MDCEKELNERPGDPSPSFPAIALTLSKPPNFYGLQFFPKDFDEVISVGFFWLKTPEIYVYKRKMTFYTSSRSYIHYLRSLSFEKSICPWN